MEEALMRNLQKEQERERRRQRDRQRRQSMSVEEREKHLARRRRNYQLRRQRAQSGAQINQTGLRISGVGEELLMLPSNEHQPTISVPNVSVKCNGLTLASPVNSVVSLEGQANKLAKLPGRLRLSHIKHLARSLDDSVDIDDGQRITVGFIMKGNTTSSCSASSAPPKGMRLNRLKQLARAVHSDVSRTAGQNGQSVTERIIDFSESY